MTRNSVVSLTLYLKKTTEMRKSLRRNGPGNASQYGLGRQRAPNRTVGPGEARDIAHIETGVRALLDHRGIRLHFPRAPIRFARLRLRAVRLEAFLIL
jgi:hypothetical protein